MEQKCHGTETAAMIQVADARQDYAAWIWNR
jgi:hypothetical protein